MTTDSSAHQLDVFQDKLSQAVHLAFELAYYALALSAAMARAEKLGFARWMRTHWHEATASAMLGFDLLVTLKAPLELNALGRPDFEPARSFTWLEPLLTRERLLLDQLHHLQASAATQLPQDTLLEVVDPLNLMVDCQIARVENMLNVLETLQLIEMDESDLNRIDAELLGR